MATSALGRGLRTNLSATPGIASTSDIEKSRKAYEPSRQRAQEALQEQSFYQSEVTGAKGAELRAKLDVEQGVREAGAKSLQDYATEEKGLIDTAKAEKEKNPFPTFQPTQEDAMSYGQLGSMIATMGVMLGSGGKASAKVAIGSLTGMMNGWQKGRKDLWEKESKTFEKEVNRIKMIRESITKDLETGLKLAGTNRDASRAALESAAYKAGSNSVIARYLATGRATDALDFAKKSADLDQKIEEQIIAAAARETMHRQTIEEQKRLRETTAGNRPPKTPDLVQIKNTKTGDTKTIDANRLTYSDTTGEPTLPEGYSIVGKVGSVGKEGGSAGGLGKIEEAKLSAKYVLLKEYDRLIEDYKKNPPSLSTSQRKLLLAAKTMGFPSAVDRVMELGRTDPKNNPNAAAVAEFIGRLETVIAPDRHSLYGANLTVNELPRYERTIPTAIDDPKVFLDFLERNRNSLISTIKDKETYYRNRGMDINTSDLYEKAPDFASTYKSGFKPEQQTEYTEGQESTSKSGRPIVFRSGKWEYK